MSECVVRMKMPEKCDECPAWCICGTLHKYMLGIDCDPDWTYDDLLVIIVETGFVKPDNCPIICQLPEGHGELIERQPIIQFIEDGLNRGEYGHDQIEVMTEVFVAETIVPAEAERSET